LNYRSDIDGLRAIAVCLVIFNHVGFNYFSGGYIGVDVFFVISGFLITAIIYPKIVQNNFKVSWFLSRRIKRLMPVLLFVIFITMLAFTLILLPQDLVKYYRSVIWIILYGANFFFWKEYGGYFDGGSQEAPLLHTWSLAVEEQYYLIWPIMLVLSIKFLGTKRTANLSILVLLVSIFVSQWGTEITIGAAYYLLPTRFFELLLGSCLAIFWDKLPTTSQKVHNVLSFVGLCLILSSTILLNEHSSFPGYNALYPTIGTALLIYSTKGFINQYLSFKPLIFTGNISYSLYLWHWPILVVLRYITIDYNFYIQILAIIFTFILSYFSWRYIEQPLRHIKIYSFKKLTLYLYIIPSLILIIIALIGIYNKGYPERFPSNIIKMDNAINSFASKSREGCHSPFRYSDILPNENCSFGYLEPERTVDLFVFGDSHANHIVPMLDYLTKNANIKGQDYTLDRCLPVFGLDWGSNAFMASKCNERNNLAKMHIQNNQFKYVVLAASWPYVSTQRIYYKNVQLTNQIEIRELFVKQLKETIEIIISSGSIPVFVEDTPTLGGKSPKCTIKKNIFNDTLDCSITRTENPMIKGSLFKLKQTYNQIIILTLHDLYCNGTKCEMEAGGLPLYRDDDHLNEEAAKYLAELYLKKNINPFTLNKKSGH
jgi:peptidoglycan/LPS O-acetylase OafA/YrhL